jgi:Patatin-like phospholipase
MNVVAYAVAPAGVEHPMVPVPTFDFSSLGFILFGAGTAFFIRLRPAFFVSHNLLSFRWLLLVASPPHHSMRRQTFSYLKSCWNRQASLGCLAPDRIAESSQLRPGFFVVTFMTDNLEAAAGPGPTETNGMSGPPGKTRGGWGWLQRPWWFVRHVVHALSPARFSFFVALAGAAVFLIVQQGTEILRGLAEPNADTGYVDFYNIIFFYAALITWALHSWYWSRVLLNHVSGGPAAHCGASARAIAWFRLHGPRILGVLPPLIIAAACFFVAPRGYTASAPGHPRATLFLFGGLATLLALLLYTFFVIRRRWLKEPIGADTGKSGASLRDGGTWRAVLAFSLFAAVVLLLFLFRPVTAGLFIGSAAIVCLAATAWVCFGSLIVLQAGRLRLPLLGLLLAWAMLCSLWNDNHRVRTVPTEPARSTSNKRPPVQQAFIAWHDAVQKVYPLGASGSSAAPRPVFIVATEGGGIRAAYWTALVLAALQDLSLDQRKSWIEAHPGQPQPPDFASHLFAISGVSGGSLGAVVFDALLAENVAYPMEDKAHDILRQDFLSPTLAAMFFPDLLQRFLPFRINAADRGAVLEQAWEYGWERTISGNAGGGAHANRLEQPFRELWQSWQGEIPLPALFLNGTRVESGKRIITSNVAINPNSRVDFADAEDAEKQLSKDGSRDLRLSTAAHMSARFTYVSPAGRLPDGGHIVDGGYFENSAAATALEILYEVESAIQQGAWPERVVPVLIEIRNGPTTENPETQRADQHEFLSEILAPVNTLLNTRDARATFSQQAIESEQESQPNQVPPNRLRFGLHNSSVPLPLGWMLSGDAAKEMRRQLTENSDNQKAFDLVMAELSGPGNPP